MNEDAPDRLREDLAFCGLIAADVSHELRNVLSVIGEYAGLLDDLIGLAEQGKPADYAKLRKLSANIARQVKRGTETMERFSRFAHAADGQTSGFDLAALVENLAALLQGRVSLAGCRLEAELPAQSLPVRGDPFALQHLVFLSIQWVLDSLEKGESVRVKLLPQGPAAVICVSGPAAGGGADRVRQQVAAAAGGCQGTIETAWANGILSLTITLPIH